MGTKNIKRMTGIGAKTAISAVLVVGAVLLLATGTAAAQTTISSCQEINSTNAGGGLVKLVGDIDPAPPDCIEINTSDIVFDGQGYTITGPGSSGVGIEVNSTSAGGGATNVTVKDVKVEKFNHGIEYDSQSGPGAGGNIINVNMTGNNFGFFPINTVPVDVTNSEMVDNQRGAQGYITGRFEGNDISNNTDHGLNLLSEAQVVNNDIKNNGGRGIWLEQNGANTRIADNEIVNNMDSGIYVDGVNDVVIENNLVTDNNQDSDNGGIGVVSASDVKITNNNRIHRNTFYGVYADNAAGLVIRNSRITENCGGNTGLRVSGTSPDVLIESTNVSNNTGTGIRYFASGSNATIRDVEASDNGGLGIAVSSTTSPTLSNIEANDNLFAGVGVTSSDADLEDITALGNGDTGIDIRGDGTVITNSEVRDNGFGGVGGPPATTGINVNAADVAVRNTVTEGNDMDVRSLDDNTTLENVDLGSATVSGTATEVEINGTPVSVPSGPSGLKSAGVYFDATEVTGGYFDATVGYGSIPDIEEQTLGLWNHTGSWNELGGTVDAGANEVSYNITSFSTFGLFGQDDSSGGGGNVPPRAEFDVSDDPTAGQTVTLDASSSEDPDGEIDRYVWTIDDTSSDKYGETVNHTFDEGGLYEVELTVRDSEGGRASTEAVVNVGDETEDSTDDSQDGSQDVEDADDDESEQDGSDSGTGGGGGDTQDENGFDIPSGDLRVGDELTLEADDVGLEGEVTSYEWTVDGEPVGSDDVVNHVLNSSGDVTITLDVSNGTTTRTFSRTISVSDVEREETDEEQQMDEGTDQQTEQNETDTNGTDDGDDDGQGLPGFTPLVALIALAFVAYRRG